MADQFGTAQLQQSAPVKFLSLGPTATRVLVITVFAALLLLYLAQSTQGATRQYQVRSLEDKLAAQTQNRESLELESVRLQSIAAVAPAPPAQPAGKSGSKPTGSQPAADSPALSPAGQITAVSQ